MSSRLASLLIAAAAVAAVTGCVEERPIHRPHPVQREVIVEQSAPATIVEVIAPQPPPPRIVEVMPPPRPGYIWVHAYWRWEGGRYVATAGHWREARPGYHYVHPHWERHNDGWHFRVGVWVSG